MSDYGPKNPWPVGPSYYDGDHTANGQQYPDHYEEDCPLCFDKLCVTSTDDRMLSVWGHCGHVFHKGCLEDWWNGRGVDGQCPTCSQQFGETLASLPRTLRRATLLKSAANRPETRSQDVDSVHKITCSFVRKCRVTK